MSISQPRPPAARGPVPAGSAPVVIVAVDLLALVAFVLAGMRSHHEGTLVEIFLRNAVPLLGTWVIVSVALSTYRRPGFATLLRTWIVAVPIALVIRSLWVGSPSEIAPFLTFLAVGLSFTLLFLAIGRGLARLVAARLGTARRRSA
ncbi:MAG: DUF3054 domain-containing protein [Actinomycetota bacterium]